jgi:hypothetical protein
LETRSGWGLLTGIWGAGDELFVTDWSNVVFHKQASRWTVMELPVDVNLLGVYGLDGNDVYFYGTGGLVHYDGHAFRDVQVPLPAGYFRPNVGGVVASKDGRLIVLGHPEFPGGPLLSFDGSNWGSVPLDASALDALGADISEMLHVDLQGTPDDAYVLVRRFPAVDGQAILLHVTNEGTRAFVVPTPVGAIYDGLMYLGVDGVLVRGRFGWNSGIVLPFKDGAFSAPIRAAVSVTPEGSCVGDGVLPMISDVLRFAEGNVLVGQRVQSLLLGDSAAPLYELSQQPFYGQGHSMVPPMHTFHPVEGGGFYNVNENRVVFSRVPSFSVPVRITPPAVVQTCEAGACRVAAGSFCDHATKAYATIDHDLWVDLNEVTNAAFAAFLAEDANSAWRKGTPAAPYYLAQWDAVGQPLASRLDHPVTFVTPEAASAFCAWKGGRLPTRLEWDHSYSAGALEVYPWGNDARAAAFNDFVDGDPFEWEGFPETTPVGFFDGSERDGFATGNGASPYGMTDMLGNVAEFAVDGQGYALCGGDWETTLFYDHTLPRAPNCAKWDADEPVSTRMTAGFRCVRE